MDQQLSIAQKKWEQQQALLAKGLVSADTGPWLIADNVPKETFEAWVREQEGRWKLAYLPRGDASGSAVMFGDPSNVHEYCSSGMCNLIRDYVAEKHGFAVARTLCTASSPTCEVELAAGGSIIKEPDGAICPLGAAGAQALPTVTIEVAHRNESHATLKWEVEEVWLAPGSHVQACIGIKIGMGRDPRLTAYFGVAEQPTAVVEFGKGTSCTGPDLPEFQLLLPVTALWHGAELPQAVQQAETQHVSIDLFLVRQHVHAFIKQPSI